MSAIVPPDPEPVTYPRRGNEVFDEGNLFDYVKRKMGGNVLDVELEESDVKDALEDFLTLYGKYKPRRCTENWLAGEGITEHKLRTVGARGVVDIEMAPTTTGLTSGNIDAQLMSGFAYFGVAAPKFDLIYLEYVRQWAKIAARELGSEEDYHISDDFTTVWIYSPGRPVRVTCTVVLDWVESAAIPRYDQELLRKYVLGACKVVVGQIRRKFASVPGAGSALTLDGPQQITEGQTMVDEVTAKIEKARGHLIPSWG